MNHIDKTIEDLQKEISEKERDLMETKILVNRLLKRLKKPPLYEEGIQSEPDVTQPLALKGDEYFGKPLATAITDVLNRRKELGMGPSEAKEVYDDLINGGFEFDQRDSKFAFRNMTISMGKNRKFLKLPNGKWVLEEWYPKRKGNDQPESKNTVTDEENNKNTNEEIPQNDEKQ